MNRTQTKVMDEYEKMARRYIEGSGGLFDMYRHELALPLCEPKEVEGARWMLICLTNPANRSDLESMVRQSELRQEIPE